MIRADDATKQEAIIARDLEEKKRDTVKAELQTLTALLSDENGKLDQVRSEVSRLKAIKEEMLQAQANFDALKKSVDERTEDQAELIATLSQLRTDVDSLEQQKQTYRTMLADIQADELRLSQLKDLVAQAQADKDNLLAMCPPVNPLEVPPAVTGGN